MCAETRGGAGGRGRAARRRAVRFGRLGESACLARLRLCGWRIMARNWRVPVGEIDIIARRGARATGRRR